MNDWRTLMTGGMLLVLAGLAYAVIYGTLVVPALEETQLVNLELSFDAALRNQPEAVRGFVRDFIGGRQRQLLNIFVVCHLVLSGLFALAVGSFVHLLELKRKWGKILTALLLGGGGCSASGFFVQSLGYGFYGQGMTLLGYAWLLAGVTGYIIMLALHVAAKPEL